MFGVAPALELSRENLNEEMKESGRGISGGARQRVRQFLVMAQVAASLVLLVGSGLLLKSFLRLGEVRPGFNPENVLVVRLALPKTQYKGNEEVFHFYQQLLGRVESLPGVQSVAVANVVPTDGFLATVEFSIVGRGWTSVQFPEAHYRMVTPAYFRTMQIPLLAGREFSERDNAQGAPVAIISQAFAKQYWPGESPLGAHIQMDDVQTGMREVEIVGVVGDIHDFGLDHEAQAEVYAPISQVPPGTIDYLKANMYWFLRTAGDPLPLATAFRRAVQGVDRDVPATSTRTLEQYLEQSLAPRRFNLILVGIFGAAALLIASMGIYGVISYFVMQRTREIGIRLALGAQREEVLRLILGHGLRLVATGVAAGLLAALLLARMIRSQLFGTSATDPATYAGITVLLLAVALLACYLPARRAMAVDPLIALRHE
jgi:putative ABC transport system permease protein